MHSRINSDAELAEKRKAKAVSSSTEAFEDRLQARKGAKKSKKNTNWIPGMFLSRIPEMKVKL